MNYTDYIKNIVAYKKLWQDADAKGDTAAKNKAAEDAQYVYRQLAATGDEGAKIAQQLTARDYTGATKFMDEYSTKDLQPARQYLMSALGSSGLKDSDFSYDSGGQTVRVKGLGLGPANYVSQAGSAYYTKDALDKAIKDIAEYATLTPPSESLYKERAVKTGYNLDDYFGYSQMPLEKAPDTEAILNRYRELGGNASRAATAEGIGDNAGNVDSYSAANARRNLMSAESAGQSAALQAYLGRGGIMGDAVGKGMDFTQNLFGNWQNELSGRVARDINLSETLGYGVGAVDLAANPYFNQDGTLKNVSTDYSAILTNLNAELNRATTAEQKADIQRRIGYATQAREAKTMLPEYSKYAGTTQGLPAVQRTLTGQDLDIKTALGAQELALQGAKIANTPTTRTSTRTASPATSAAPGAAPGTAADYKPHLTASQVQTAIKDGIINEGTVADYNAHFRTNYTVEDMQRIYGSDSSPGDDQQVTVVDFRNVNPSDAAAYGVDKYGTNLINALKKEAQSRGGILTEEEVFTIAVNTSDANDTNLKQIEKVYQYLGLDGTILSERVKDKGIFPWAWHKGVVAK